MLFKRRRIALQCRPSLRLQALQQGLQGRQMVRRRRDELAAGEILHQVAEQDAASRQRARFAGKHDLGNPHLVGHRRDRRGEVLLVAPGDHQHR